ncbi:MAG: hypothetical protein LBR84_02135 [Tannerella sp.]|jgi:hypothetical protein|nr:hypothetical protein [Tannerella sp.]
MAKPVPENYLIRASLYEEAIEPWVWCNSEVPNGYVTIKNVKNSKKITVFQRRLNANFARKYDNAKTLPISDIFEENKILVISEFYRNFLDIQTSKEDGDGVTLTVTKAKWWQLLLLPYPNPTVQLANRLTYISIFISVFSILIGVLISKGGT